MAGERVMLDLKVPDPVGALYRLALVEVVDWQDRVTGQSWGTALLHKSHPLHQHYLERMHGNDLQPDPDVVAVKAGRGTWLVHASEVGDPVSL